MVRGLCVDWYKTIGELEKKFNFRFINKSKGNCTFTYENIDYNITIEEFYDKTNNIETIFWLERLGHNNKKLVLYKFSFKCSTKERWNWIYHFLINKMKDFIEKGELKCKN